MSLFSNLPPTKRQRVGDKDKPEARPVELASKDKRSAEYVTANSAGRGAGRGDIPIRRLAFQPRHHRVVQPQAKRVRNAAAEAAQAVQHAADQKSGSRNDRDTDSNEEAKHFDQTEHEKSSRKDEFPAEMDIDGIYDPTEPLDYESYTLLRRLDKVAPLPSLHEVAKVQDEHLTAEQMRLRWWAPNHRGAVQVKAAPLPPSGYVSGGAAQTLAARMAMQIGGNDPVVLRIRVTVPSNVLYARGPDSLASAVCEDVVEQLGKKHSPDTEPPQILDWLSWVPVPPTESDTGRHNSIVLFFFDLGTEPFAVQTTHVLARHFSEPGKRIRESLLPMEAGVYLRSLFEKNELA